MKQKPPYHLGLICLVPFAGALVGIAMIVLAIVKFKDKKLAIIGVAGILWTFVSYYAIIQIVSNITGVNSGFHQISQMQLNSLVKNIEFYKLSHGTYPENLAQLLTDDAFAPVHDPVQGLKSKENAYFIYERLGDKYRLFSSGADGIAGTKDDLFPEVTITDSTKIGLLLQGE